MAIEIFEMFKDERNMRNLSEYPLHFKTFTEINPSFVTTTKPLSKKIGGTVYEGLK